MIRSLKIRYVAGLALIAFIIGLGQLFVQLAQRDEAMHSDLLGTALRLSEGSQSLGRFVTLAQMDPSSRRNRLFKKNALSDMKQKLAGDHELLRSQGYKIAPDLISKIDQEFRLLTSGLDSLVKHQKKAADYHRLLAIGSVLGSEQAYRQHLNELASELRTISRKKISQLRFIEGILALLLFMVLFFEGWFVFRPAVSKVEQSLTQLKASEVKLLEARSQAERALKIRSEFITNISHEIRNPLNAILGMSELLDEGPVDLTQKRQIATLRRAGKTILELLNDFLDFSRLESGRIEIERINYKPDEVIQKASELFVDRVDKKHLILSCETGPLVPELVSGDSKRVQQIITNLIGNAVKFTPDGGSIQVAVNANLAANRLFFTVKDSGIGIPEEKKGDLFQSFFQVDSSISRKFGGNGLGLAISKQLAELMSGRVYFESQIGKGSTFTLELPILSELISPQPGLPVVLDPVVLAQENFQARVLIVEDSEDNREVLKAFLRKSGLSLEFAENGKVAVEKFKVGDFQIILMDMQMPEMDGFEATRQIRAWELEQGLAKIPIFAITAYGHREEIEKCIQAGCSSHLSKPIDRVRLNNLINSSLSVTERCLESRPLPRSLELQ